MERSTVIVVPCRDYDENRVYSAMKTGIDALGGIGAFVKPEEKILVKPNFLKTAGAEKAVTTHPAVIKNMLRILSEEGFSSVTYGDSPAAGSCRNAATAIGLKDEVYGAVMGDMSHEITVDFPEGNAVKQFHFASEVAENDALINLCKMKTHALETITGAVKNLFGLICGRRKAAGHVSYPNAGVFARALCDIHRYVKPRLHIMDGITAMEGNGPGSGDPVQMGVMLFSTDPVAIDTVFCRLINLNPGIVPTCVQGEACGIGTCDESRICVMLADPESQAAASEVSFEELFKRFGNPGFNVDRQGKGKGLLGRVSGLAARFGTRPVLDSSKCVKCGVCVDHCPVPGGGIRFDNGKDKAPVYDYSKCVRCYCCQELCPGHAISKK